jgi:hypothetical protein
MRSRCRCDCGAQCPTRVARCSVDYLLFGRYVQHPRASTCDRTHCCHCGCGCRSYPGTLLCLFYGLFSLDIPRSSTLHCVVMANVFPPPHGANLHQVFDLKGSTYNRRVLSESELVCGEPQPIPLLLLLLLVLLMALLCTTYVVLCPSFEHVVCVCVCVCAATSESYAAGAMPRVRTGMVFFCFVPSFDRAGVCPLCLRARSVSCSTKISLVCGATIRFGWAGKSRVLFSNSFRRMPSFFGYCSCRTAPARLVSCRLVSPCWHSPPRVCAGPRLHRLLSARWCASGVVRSR